MKKQLLCLLSIIGFYSASAQYDYSPNGRNDAPILGMQWGFVGGGFSAMLPNRDDLDADQRLDPQTMNFSYAAGVEGVYWFQKTVGFGGQLLYWMGGAAYTGKDTITKLSLTGKTELSYLKLPLLFHFKSFNRYYPNRRVRFSAQFGPYIAFLGNYSDKISFKDEAGKEVENQTVATGMSVTSTIVGSQKGKITGEIYNPLDLGFVFAVGGELRLWTRTIVTVHLRADIGFSNVENTKGMKIKYGSDTTQYDFNYWSGDYAKYNEPNAIDVSKGWASNRPATKNFSLGAFIGVRKYLK